MTVNNKLVGMIHGAFTEACPIIKYIPLHAGGDDVDQLDPGGPGGQGPPGAGFVPTSSPAPGPA